MRDFLGVGKMRGALGSRVVVACVLTVVGETVVAAALGRNLIGGNATWVVVADLFALCTVPLAWYLGTARGFAALWCLLLVAWAALLLSAAHASGGTFLGFSRLVPGRFIIWSFIALPLWSSALAIRGHHSLGGGHR